MSEKKQNLWKDIDLHILVPGGLLLLLLVVVGAAFPTAFNNALQIGTTWLLEHFKWLYILCIIGICAVCFWLIFSKYGDIKLGGKHAKPSINMFTWCTLSLTGTIAVGICFYGVSGPVSLFMNPPAFLNVAAGSKEAVVPTLEYCFLHYGLPAYFIITFFAMILSLLYYNGKKELKGSSILYPLIGDKANSWYGNLANILITVCLIVCGTNMGLAVIQLNSGIGTVLGMSETPNFILPIIIIYTITTAFFATSGVHKMMGTLSNINAICYVIILLFVLFATDANRLLNLFFTTMGQFIVDFIPMISFGDAVHNTGWQNNTTMFYYAWNLVPGLLQAIFYVSISYGRTLRQFLMMNCVIPSTVTFIWYTIFGGSAMFGILDDTSNIYTLIQQYGDGIATFAFLDTLPLASIMKWVFIIVAIMSFITFADSIAFSYPMLLMKKTETDASKTHTPKILNVTVALFMGVLTAVLLFAGGYDALNNAIVFMGLPAALFTILVIISGIKFLLNREKYDETYKEELLETEQIIESVSESTADNI